MTAKSTAASNAPAPVVADDRQTAQYVADLLKELERLAGRRGLVRLHYLLIECREEAENIIAAA